MGTESWRTFRQNGAAVYRLPAGQTGAGVKEEEYADRNICRHRHWHLRCVSGNFEISRKQRIKSIDKIRHRIELGKDTYSDGKISPELEEELCAVLEDFVRIMDGYKVDAYRAVASSALREAQNSLFIIGKIRQLTGLEVTILSNSEQRFLSYKALATMETDFNKIIEKGTAIIDLDGGSTQVSLFDKDALVTTQNLRMGSVRIRERLSGIASETSHYETLVKEFIWNEMLSFKKMYLKDRKIENVMLLGDFSQMRFSRTRKSVAAGSFQEKPSGTGFSRSAVILRWNWQ